MMFEELFNSFLSGSRSSASSPLLISGVPGSGKTFFLEKLSKLLTDRDEIVFLVDTIDYLPKDIMDPTHPDYNEDKTKGILGLFQACLNHSPCWLFLDNFDFFGSQDERSEYSFLLGTKLYCSALEQLRGSFLSLMDKAMESGIRIIAAVEEPKYLFPKFTRAGRFDRIIHIPIPSVEQREQLLSISISELCLDWNDNMDEVSFRDSEKTKKLINYLAINTPGFVSRDLRMLVNELQLLSKNGIISWDNVEIAMERIKPSQMNYFESRFVGTKNKKLKNETVAGCHELSSCIKMLIQFPLQFPEKYEKFNLKKKSNGILLYGPGGCGKTFATKVLLQDHLGSSVNIVDIQGPRLFSKYVGDTEATIRNLFLSARKLSPSILVIDELDAIAAKRDEESGGVHDRALSTLLNEIDGVEERSEVFIIGCTSRPDSLDPAIIRPGRLDRMVYLNYPNEDERKEMIELLEKQMPLELSNEDKNDIVNRTDGYSYADIKGLCREAAMNALRYDLDSTKITKNHFSGAFFKYQPCQISKEQIDVYKKFDNINKQ